jgi:hypothetical protein
MGSMISSYGGIEQYEHKMAIQKDGLKIIAAVLYDT